MRQNSHMKKKQNKKQEPKGFDEQIGVVLFLCFKGQDKKFEFKVGFDLMLVLE